MKWNFHLYFNLVLIICHNPLLVSPLQMFLGAVLTILVEDPRRLAAFVPFNLLGISHNERLSKTCFFYR